MTSIPPAIAKANVTAGEAAARVMAGSAVIALSGLGLGEACRVDDTGSGFVLGGIAGTVFVLGINAAGGGAAHILRHSAKAGKHDISSVVAGVSLIAGIGGGTVGAYAVATEN